VDVTQEPERVRTADRLVMPGQGGFRDCARALQGELGQAVRRHLDAQRPYLGICLGLQVLFEESDEAPGWPGLGVLKGRVEKLVGGVEPGSGAPLKIPHMGWNLAEPAPGNRGLLTDGPPLHYYFVHSFIGAPVDASVVASTTEYGARFVSAVAYRNVFACQFHPEKSQQAGLSLLERFLSS
jgi:glutamine amidotransferase